jgi:hypothetical protein
MILVLNGAELDIPESFDANFVEQLYAHGKEEYDKQSNEVKAIAMVPTHMVLKALEKKFIRTHGKEFALQIARPAKREDPNLFLLRFIGGLLLEAMKNAELTINYTPVPAETECGAAEGLTPAGSVTALSLSFRAASQGATGGSLDSDRLDGERQDNRFEIS